ncbi:cytochrome P450 [Gigaspora margarita]|uniref:Cytochrome P450 n=1 Tax=Gigaspora margarita TaxID=4874 RepID=A0A8H3XCK1_GIGMA|nr:cytochrome P450 [Gigaspora margarita]
MASYYNVHSPEKITLSNALIEDSEKFIERFTDYHFGFSYFIYFSSFLRHYMPFIRSKVKYLLKNRDHLFETLDMIIKKRRKEIEEIPMANAFSFLVYYVCHSPHVKQKMIDEIDSVFPPNTSFNLKYDDLLKLEYCDAIINEVGRIMPVGNEIRRYLANPAEVAGYQWEAGTMIHIHINGIHSHKNHWSNPEIFDPDRFYKENDNNEMNDKARHKFSLIPFGGGLRICPGRKLAMIELLSLMVTVFGKYDVDLVDINAPLNTKSGSLTTCGGLPVRIRSRKLPV